MAIMVNRNDAAGSVIHLLTNPIVEKGATVQAYKDLACCVDDTFNRLADGQKKTDWDTNVRQRVVGLKTIIQAAIDSCNRCVPSVGSSQEKAQGLDCYKKTMDVLCEIAAIAKNMADWVNQYGNDCINEGESCYNALRVMNMCVRKEAEDVIRTMPAMSEGTSNGGSSFFDNNQNLIWIGAGGALLAAGAWFLGRKSKRR